MLTYCAILLLIPINCFWLYYIFNVDVFSFDIFLGIVLVSIGAGRLIGALTSESLENMNNIGDKRYTPFLRYLGYSSVMLVTFAVLFMLIKHSQENYSPAVKLLEKEQKQNPPTPVQTKANNETNKIIKPKIQEAPSSWMPKNKE